MFTFVQNAAAMSKTDSGILTWILRTVTELLLAVLESVLSNL